MDYFVGFSNATYLCQTLFSNVPISYCIAQIIVLHINLVSTEIRFIIDYIDVIIFLRRASLKEHYILWKCIKLLNIYTHTFILHSTRLTEYISIYCLKKQTSFARIASGNSLLALLLHSIRTHIFSFDIIIYGNCL